MQQVGHLVNVNELGRFRIKLAPNSIEELVVFIGNANAILNVES